MTANLFQSINVTLHSGQESDWKIDCDALTDEDLATIAKQAVKWLPPFGSVEGVPTGGLRLAKAFEPYITEGILLIVDDVCTTGASMEFQRGNREANGFVIFERGSSLADWIHPFWWCGLSA